MIILLTKLKDFRISLALHEKKDLWPYTRIQQTTIDSIFKMKILLKLETQRNENCKRKTNIIYIADVAHFEFDKIIYRNNINITYVTLSNYLQPKVSK